MDCCDEEDDEDVVGGDEGGGLVAKTNTWQCIVFTPQFRRNLSNPFTVGVVEIA